MAPYLPFFYHAKALSSLHPTVSAVQPPCNVDNHSRLEQLVPILGPAHGIDWPSHTCAELHVEAARPAPLRTFLIRSLPACQHSITIDSTNTSASTAAGPRRRRPIHHGLQPLGDDHGRLAAARMMLMRIFHHAHARQCQIGAGQCPGVLLLCAHELSTFGMEATTVPDLTGT